MNVLHWLLQFKYLAMFGILFLCGLGLPLPEEVTLIGTGILVGRREADFFLASVVCVLGILAGDSIVFGLGHHYGRRFLLSRPMRFLLSPRRQVKVARFFARHGSKAVFFARFFAGVRMGVYAYAGSQRMSWLRFLLLDFLGAMISGPTSILLGSWAWRVLAPAPDLEDMDLAEARALEQAEDKARQILHYGLWVFLGVLLAIALGVFIQWCRRRHAVRQAAGSRRALPAAALAEEPPRDPVATERTRSED